MRRLQPACLALVLLLISVPVAHAQLGGLKKKVVDKATGKDTVAVAGKAGGKAKCDASAMVITGDVVDRYLKSLAAGGGAMQQLAKEPGKPGAYYSALLKRHAIQQRKAEYDLHKGPDWEKHVALQKRFKSEAMAGKDFTSTVRENDALTESLDVGKVQIPELEWESQQKGNARVDSTMIAAGGFSACDWTDLGERVPRLASLLVNDPTTKDYQGFGTEKDAAAIRLRVPELSRALGLGYVSPQDKARLEADSVAERKAKQEEAAKPVSSGDPQVDCIAQAQQEYAKAHQAELDAAREKNDMAAIMKLSLDMNQAASKCVSQ